LTALALIAGSLLLMRIFSDRGRSWLAPWNGYLFAQGFCLGVAYLKLVPTMSDFELSTWLAVWLSAISFFAGSIFAFGAFRRKGLEIRDTREADQVVLKLAKGAFPILLVCFTIGVYMSYKSANGWPMFAESPEDARKKFAWPGFIGVMFFQSIYCLALAGMAIRKIGDSKSWRLAGLVGILFPIFVGVLSGMRFYAFLVGLSWILFEDVLKPIRVGRLLGLGLVIIGVLMSVFLGRMGMLNWSSISFGLTHLEYAKTVYVPLYLYIANNFWNLDWMFHLHESTRSVTSTLGYSSFWGFLYPTYMTFPIDRAFDLEMQFQSILKIRSLNTTTYQGVLFVDFGWIGLATIPGILGFASSWSFLKAKRTGGVGDSLMHAVLGFAIFFGFFTWIPRQPSYAFGMILVLLLAGFAKAMVALRSRNRKRGGAPDEAIDQGTPGC
jgi:oligosaccharide repeat unit polymerase